MRRLILVAPLLTLAAAPVALPQDRPVPPGLESLWSHEGVLRDADGDGFVDDVAAVLSIGSARPAASAQAANIAARLGFETLSADLPHRAEPGDLVIVVDGRQADGESGRLGPSLPLPGRGHVLLGRDGLRRLEIWGDDDAGLAAAAGWVAGRLPALWDPEGLALAEVGDSIAAALEAADIEVHGWRVAGVCLRADVDGVETLLLEVELEAPPAADAAVEALTPVLPESVGALRLEWSAREHSGTVVVTGASLPPRRPGARRGGGKERFSLERLYEPGGLLGDEDGDLIADRTDFLVSTDRGPLPGLVDLGIRVGLESAGITLPLAEPADTAAGDGGPLRLLVGGDHPALRELAADGRLGPNPPAATGRLEVASEAPDEDVALVARGDERGMAALLDWLAVRAPNLDARGFDRPGLTDLADGLWRFLSQRSPAGQAAGAHYALEQMLAELPGTARDVAVEVAVEGAESGLADSLRALAGDRILDLDVENLDVRSAATLLDRSFEIEGEIADVRARLEPVWERIQPGERVEVEVRVSEPRSVRLALGREIAERIHDVGAEPADVAVLPAYKQGFGWIEERLLPRLRELEVSDVSIGFARYRPPEEWPGQAMGTPTRWLLELFPVDEILARELDLPLDAIAFRELPPGGPTYEVVARDAAGAEILRERFHTATVTRPYFDTYPRYEKVRVTTGRVRVSAGERLLLDERVATDPERFWDLYQGEVLAELHDMVLRIHEGRPRSDLAPHFGELRVELELSEPDRALGIDQERIAPIESLHEEIYFGTLHFMDLVGRVAAGSTLPYPGRVIPVVRPTADGAGGRVRFHLTGFRSPGPRVVVSYLEDELPRRRVRNLEAIDVDRPLLTAVEVEAERPGLAAVEAWLPVDSEEDRRAELVARTSARRVDRSWLTAHRVASMLATLASLRETGLYRSELSWQGMGDLRVLTSVGHRMQRVDTRVAVLTRGGEPDPFPDPATLLDGSGTDIDGRLVQWRTPIPPAEANRIVATLAAEFDAAAAHRVGRSYLGQEIWALELTSPLPGSHWSRAKAAELKPTVIYSARQHANEVSSTSHVLRLAEELLTDPARREILDRLNVVIHPITNPDGAQLAWELWQITPDHMLHAGYLGALGVDVTAGSGDPDPIYPESNVRERLWEAWRPDIFLNPHGYPSHEWVQMFSEYAGWVRHRTTESRGWWGMRGWFMPGFSWLDDPDYPRHRDEQFRIRDFITAAINDLEPAAALNRRAYDRYRRYGFAFDPDAFKLDFADDVLIYTSIEGSRAGGGGWVERNPKVTIWSGSTEAPDETAHGDWLELVASAGLAWDRAILDYLLSTEHPVERFHRVDDREARLSLHRERPGRAPGDEAEESR